jgi:Photosynthesis system II assembly factor YCF48
MRLSQIPSAQLTNQKSPFYSVFRNPRLLSRLVFFVAGVFPGLPVFAGFSNISAQVKGTKQTSTPQWVWQNPLPQGNTLQSVSFTDPNNGTALGAAGTIIRTTDGGNNWVILASGTSDDLYGVSFTDVNNGTAVGNFGVILRTTDGGQNWVTQREGMNDVLYGVSFTDTNNGTAVGSDGLILRTTRRALHPYNSWDAHFRKSIWRSTKRRRN